MRLRKPRIWATAAAATLTLGVTGISLAAAPAAHASCLTAGCNLAAGDDSTLYLDPSDVNGFGDLSTYLGDITDASSLSYYADSSGTIHDEYGSGVFGSGTTGCTDMKTFQTAGGGTWALVTNLDGTGWDQSAAESIINNSTTRSTFASNVATLINTTGTGCSNGFKFDGIELDFENLQSTDRTGLNATIDDLATDLHNDSKLLAVSVFAKSSDQPTGYPTQDAEDWGHITSKADLMNVQGYGYCWESGCVNPPGPNPPGPIGPEYWDKAAMDYAVTALGSTVVGSEVNLMMPLYGIDWPGTSTGTDVTYTSDSATTTNGAGVKNDVQDLISHYGGSSSFQTTDSSSNTIDSPYYNYTQSGTSHGVWFTNGTMVGDIINGVAATDGLNGIGFWRGGGEDTSIWTAVSNNWLVQPTGSPSPSPSPTATTSSPTPSPTPSPTCHHRKRC